MPLNQFRNYQALINLVPGATPAGFQNAETDTPARSLSTNVNGQNRNANATRSDGATNVNIWLPHHVMYVAPAETIDTVNISTNDFDAEQGMAGGAAITVITKSGTNNFKGSAFYFNNNEKLNASPYYFGGLRPEGKPESHPSTATSTAAPWAAQSRRTSCSSSAPSKATSRPRRPTSSSTCRTRPCAPATSEARSTRTGQFR